jgi:dUTP pyrophosphatase
MFVKLASGATAPQRATSGSAGYDLAAYGAHVLQPGINKIRTGVSVSIPDGYYGQIALRSGFSSRTGCVATAGVIDSDYRGEIMVMVIAPSKIHLNDGEKFAQMILIRIATPELTIVNQLPSAEQEHLGFGSTDFKPKEDVYDMMIQDTVMTPQVVTQDTVMVPQVVTPTAEQQTASSDNITDPGILSLGSPESLNDFLNAALQNGNLDNLM